MINPEECEDREWIIPTGTGGYSSSTICGINSRTYHGYLIVPKNPPHFRHLVLSKFEDFFIQNGIEYPISTNRYNFQVYYPEGYKFLNRFILGSNFVVWEYNFENSLVRKTLVVNKGTNSVTITYESDKGLFKICPLITYRSHHVALKERPGFFDFQTKGDTIVVTLNDNKILNFKIEGEFNIENTGYWYYNFFYKLDYERGSNYLEDLYNPFCIITKNNEITITAYVDSFVKSTKIHLRKDVLQMLSSAGRDFVVKGKDGWAIIAGYHWFDEWGRDSFISMEGLVLLNGEYSIAKDIISRYLEYEERGFLPNGFLHNGEPIYKGVDVSLWAINAIYKYYVYSRDLDFIKKIFPKLIEIIDWYWKGNGIVETINGLLFHTGSPRTWMDAEFDTTIVTPREGAAVEINALWYNALKIMDFLSKELKINSDEFEIKAEKVKAQFIEKFVSPWGLYDYLNPDLTPDSSIRPNQLFAFSLPFNVVDENIGKRIVNTVEKELLRPYGLSTLSKSDKKYIPFYRGDRRSRDLAYHNGPIWPWLIGSYIDAKIKLERGNIIGIKKLINYLQPLINVAMENNGYIPELFEDIPPYKWGGCIAQAWSVAEVFRSLNNIISS